MNETAVSDPNATDQASSELQAGDPNLQSTPPEGVNPSDTAPEPQAPRGLSGSGLRYSDADDVPDWAKGRTADEILSTAQQLYEALQAGQTAPAPAPAPTYQQAPTPAPTPQQGLPEVDPNLIYSNPHEYHRQMEARQQAMVEARLNAASASVTSPMASMAKEQARMHRPEVWKKYGPEIEATMRQLGPQARADVSSWKRVVNYVAGEHVDELAAAKAQEMMSRGADSGSLRTQGGPPSMDPKSGMSPIRKLFAEEHPAIHGHLKDRITPETVIKHAAKRGYTEEAYAELLIKNATRSAGATR